MKVVEYKIYGSFIEITFMNELDLKITVSIRDNGNNDIVTLEEVDDGITFEEVREIMAIVESGKIEIEIGE